jgi:hypothetical protein
MFIKTLLSTAGLCLVLAFLPLSGVSQHLEGTSNSDPGIDPRIYQHYSSAEIEEMRQLTPHKFVQLNYYFRESWQLRQNPACPNCPMPDPSTIDITVYEHLRQLDRPNSIQLAQPGPYLVLLPRQEVQARYRQIK